MHKPSTAGPGEVFLTRLTYFGSTALPSSGGEVQGDLYSPMAFSEMRRGSARTACRFEVPEKPSALDSACDKNSLNTLKFCHETWDGAASRFDGTESVSVM
jgi:hypothetical protein